ncbi:MAG: hypothetical protein M1834_000413 [Cirrosporium novae-zelandiae]|nr:MAG: hypothetical protein M1834_000413 [Cirrosporium novae-zelandiae]
MSKPTSSDPAVASIIGNTNPSDLDDLLESDHDDNFFSNYRAARMQQLHTEVNLAKSAGRSVTTLTSESEVLSLTTETPPRNSDDEDLRHNRVIIHFFHPDFTKCDIMDIHLAKLAKVHYETSFYRVSVLNCPFLVGKLSIRVLPCVIGFVDGVAAQRIVGFEGLGGDSEGKGFQTWMLEGQFVDKKVLSAAMMGDADEDGVENRDSRKALEEDEDYDDWD